jgi:hypothetical protein
MTDDLQGAAVVGLGGFEGTGRRVNRQNLENFVIVIIEVVVVFHLSECSDDGTDDEDEGAASWAGGGDSGLST